MLKSKNITNKSPENDLQQPVDNSNIGFTNNNLPDDDNSADDEFDLL
jgi:hypothetical protein